MNPNHNKEVQRINHLNSEMESLYHRISLKLGITDSVSMVLYAIYNGGNECLLRDIYKNSGASKQTIHSAVRSLEADGMLYLESHTGRSKKVVFTEKGRAYAQKTAAKVLQAEIQAFDTWSEEEIHTYIQLMEKYVQCFRRQVEDL